VSNSRDLREQILCTASQALVEDGFFGASMRKIASKTGVHPSTIGVLFGGRGGLLKAAEERLKQGRTQAVQS
jgi:AcrR family transcriptional regulator